jgi:hypothetical protein
MNTILSGLACQLALNRYMAQKYTKSTILDWFRGKVRSAFALRKNITTLKPERYRSNVIVGKMYFFYYDPLHKDKLPEYDRFPLVFPIEYYDNGFLGLNFHYLTYIQRQQLLSQLMRFANNQNLTPQTKLLLSYDLLSSTKRMKYLSNKAIKRYLKDHVRSRFVEITPDEWDKALELPVEDFVRK